MPTSGSRVRGSFLSPAGSSSTRNSTLAGASGASFSSLDILWALRRSNLKSTSRSTVATERFAVIGDRNQLEASSGRSGTTLTTQILELCVLGVERANNCQLSSDLGSDQP